MLITDPSDPRNITRIKVTLANLEIYSVKTPYYKENYTLLIM